MTGRRIALRQVARATSAPSVVYLAVDQSPGQHEKKNNERRVFSRRSLFSDNRRSPAYAGLVIAAAQRAPSGAAYAIAAAKRLLTSSQLTVFHHAAR